MSVAWPAGAVSKGAYLHHLTSMFYDHFQLLSTLISVLSSHCFPTGSTTYLPTIFCNSNHHPAPPLHSGYWIWDPPLSCPATSSKFAYPAPLGIFITGCVIVQLWFYNMLLKGSGILWSSWSFRNSKTIMPQTPVDCALQDSFQREPDPLLHGRASLANVLLLESTIVS